MIEGTQKGQTATDHWTIFIERLDHPPATHAGRALRSARWQVCEQGRFHLRSEGKHRVIILQLLSIERSDHNATQLCRMA